MKIVTQVEVVRISEDSFARNIEFAPLSGDVDLFKPDALGRISFRKGSDSATENPWIPALGDKLTLTLTKE